MKTQKKMPFGNCPDGLCLSYAGANLLAYLTGNKFRGALLVAKQKDLSAKGGTVEMVSSLIDRILGDGSAVYYLYCLALAGGLTRKQIIEAICNQLGGQERYTESEYIHLVLHVDQNGSDHCLYAHYYHATCRLVVFDPAKDESLDVNLNWLLDEKLIIAIHVLSLCGNNQHVIVLSDDTKDPSL